MGIDDDRREFPWFVRGFYAPHVKSPKVPGALAIETKHKTESSRDIEIKVLQLREDISGIAWGRR